jgi:hypothetical protein
LDHWGFTHEGVPSFDYINKSPLNLELETNPSKPLADLYIDNAMWPFAGEPLPLRQIARDLLKRGILQRGGD